MKVGDVVKVIDKSYCMFDDGELRHIDDRVFLCRRRWRVVARELIVPTNDYGNPPKPNDIMLRDVSRPGNILFTQSRYCVLQNPEPARFTVPAGTKELVITFEKG